MQIYLSEYVFLAKAAKKKYNVHNYSILFFINAMGKKHLNREWANFHYIQTMF